MGQSKFLMCVILYFPKYSEQLLCESVTQLHIKQLKMCPRNLNIVHAEILPVALARAILGPVWIL